jgi:glycosyltransferase involved in cell wall biosynthesis
MKGRATIHVGLNAHLLSQRAGYRRAGIHNYIQQLVHYLPAVDEHLQVMVFTGQSRGGQRDASSALDWHTSQWPTERPWVRIAWEQLAQPWALRRAGVHLLHAMAFVSPLVAVVPTVITVHDLSFLRFPERFRPANRLYLSTMTRLSCRRARRVIAVSQATANETVRLLGVPTEHIDVVPHGVHHARFRPLPPSQVEAFQREKGLPGCFVLFLGTLEPRKNLRALIEAFARIEMVRQGIKLVIAGGKGWYYQEIFKRVEELGLEDAVLFPGFVPDAELPLWYNAATVFVYPSLYEGFGMPLLEAMACGTPVIGADASCTPEVVGDAGLLVPPHDVAALADSLEHLLVDTDLQADLGQRGQARAAAYTWEKTAAATVASYRRALKGDENWDTGEHR